MTITPVSIKKDEKPKPQTTRFVLDGPTDSKTDVRASWPLIFDALQRPVDKVELELGTRSKTVALTAEPVDDWYNPDRGLNFKPLTFRLPPQPLPAALARAWNDTTHNVSAIYYLIRGLFQQRLSKDAVGGPIKIADWAYSTAQQGFDAFVPFLAVLSINLAVINFLPIPPSTAASSSCWLPRRFTAARCPKRLSARSRLWAWPCCCC